MAPSTVGEMSFDLTDEHMKGAFRTMNNLRKDKIMCDIILAVEDREIYAHKLVLVSSIPYFYSMFTNDLVESRQTRITLKGMNAEAIEAVIDFAYTANLSVSSKNVQILLPVATILQMNRVQKACCDYLEAQLDATNCLGIYAFAELHGCIELKAKAKNYCDNYFGKVIKHEEFLLLPLERVCWYLSHNELCVRSESEVFLAGMEWIQYGKNQREKYMARILGNIRLHLLPKSFLLNQLEENSFINSEPGCKTILEDVINDLENGKESKQTRRSPLGSTVVYSAGGYLKHSLSNLDCYNPETGEWNMLKELPNPKSGAGSVFVGGQLYLVGGRNNSANGNMDSDSVERYDPFYDEWSSVASLTVPRNRLGVGVIDGVVYAIGGSDGMVHLNSAETYDIEDDCWTQVSPMSTKRIGVAVAVLNRRLYAIGGFDGENRLRSTEYYCPESRKWTQAAPMNTPRSGTGAACLEGKIYAIGGYNGITQLNSAECYDADENRWVMVSPMKCHRSALSVAVVNNKIYALGGYDGEQFLSSIETYDDKTDCWQTLTTTLPLGKSGAGVAVGIKPPS
eukprot:gene7959-8817_t